MTGEMWPPQYQVLHAFFYNNIKTENLRKFKNTIRICWDLDVEDQKLYFFNPLETFINGLANLRMLRVALWFLWFTILLKKKGVWCGFFRRARCTEWKKNHWLLDRFSNQEAFCDSLNPGYLNDYVSHTFPSLDLRKSPQFGEMTAHRDMDM